MGMDYTLKHVVGVPITLISTFERKTQSVTRYDEHTGAPRQVDNTAYWLTLSNGRAFRRGQWGSVDGLDEYLASIKLEASCGSASHDSNVIGIVLPGHDSGQGGNELALEAPDPDAVDRTKAYVLSILEAAKLDVTEDDVRLYSVLSVSC